MIPPDWREVSRETLWSRVAKFGGRALSGGQSDLLTRYRDWLVEEAIPAGGLGPKEARRLDDRHIGDSLLFASVLEGPVEQIWDLGSGVGLPGIPLAILLPETRLVLFDRSGRRVWLIRRAVRVLELSNVEVRQADIHGMTETTDVIVSRATLPPPEAAGAFHRLLNPGGVAVMGGSWERAPLVEGWETREIPAEMLDHPVWLLIMRRQ